MIRRTKNDRSNEKPFSFIFQQEWVREGILAPAAGCAYHHEGNRRVATMIAPEDVVIQFVFAEISSDGPYWWAYLRQFDTYYVLFAAATIATFIATPVYIRVAGRFGWVDHPGGRKRHTLATATMGGLVVFGTVFSGAVVTLSANNLVGEMLRASSTYVYSLMGCAAAMVVLGIVDDRIGVRPRTKLLVQSLVAVVAIALGFRVEAITLPWLDSVVLPEAVGLLLSFFWIVGITNAINLTDGLDGLAAGICFLAASVNAVVAIWLGNHYMTVMMVLLSGSLLGFLRYNFHPARVFLGDTGSLALGMFLALASLRSAQKSHTAVLILIPLFALGYPIFDTLLAIARRGLRGQPLFASDRDHIHHRLIDRGAKPSTAAIQIYIASFVLCLVCLAAAVANHFVLGIGITFVLLMTVFSARVLGYLEWGGWSARWSGRGDMRILHAAANLARMKLRRAKSDEERLAAIAVLAAEMPCSSLELLRGGETVARRDVGGNGCLTSEASESDRRFTLSPNMILRVVIDGAGAWDAERTILFESVAEELVGEEFNAK